MRAAADTEVGVLPQQPGILFVNANDILDNYSSTVMCRVCTRL